MPSSSSDSCALVVVEVLSSGAASSASRDAVGRLRARQEPVHIAYSRVTGQELQPEVIREISGAVKG